MFEEEKLNLSHLYWRKEPDVLERMVDPTAVYLNGKIFVGERLGQPGYHQFLCVFDVGPFVVFDVIFVELFIPIMVSFVGCCQEDMLCDIYVCNMYIGRVSV